MPGKRKALPGGPLGYLRWRSADQAARGRPWLSHGKPRLQIWLFFPWLAPTAARCPESPAQLALPTRAPTCLVPAPAERTPRRAGQSERSRRRGESAGSPASEQGLCGLCPLQVTPRATRVTKRDFPASLPRREARVRATVQ